MHLYIVVPCRTPKCNTAHVLMYLGEKGSAIGPIEYGVPHPLRIECPKCGKSYDYARAEEDFREVEFPQPPPAGFSNQLERYDGLKEPPLREN
jgi:hypothetical protein